MAETPRISRELSRLWLSWMVTADVTRNVLLELTEDFHYAGVCSSCSDNLVLSSHGERRSHMVKDANAYGNMFSKLYLKDDIHLRVLA